ncbi:unnamed protein product, partial [Polarella glacialis]
VLDLRRAYGIAGLWRGAPVGVVRGAVLSSSQTAAYDATKTFCRSRGILEDGPLLHAAASLVAALALTTAVIPLDVVLTRYQTATDKEAGAGVAACAGNILRQEGPSGFLRGWGALFVRMAPSSFTTFLIYEQLRKLAGMQYLS